jgi:hypothetical protein
VTANVVNEESKAAVLDLLSDCQPAFIDELSGRLYHDSPAINVATLQERSNARRIIGALEAEGAVYRWGRNGNAFSYAREGFPTFHELWAQWTEELKAKRGEEFPHEVQDAIRDDLDTIELQLAKLDPPLLRGDAQAAADALALLRAVVHYEDDEEKAPESLAYQVIGRTQSSTVPV